MMSMRISDSRSVEMAFGLTREGRLARPRWQEVQYGWTELCETPSQAKHDSARAKRDLLEHLESETRGALCPARADLLVSAPILLFITADYSASDRRQRNPTPTSTDYIATLVSLRGTHNCLSFDTSLVVDLLVYTRERQTDATL